VRDLLPRLRLLIDFLIQSSVVSLIVSSVEERACETCRRYGSAPSRGGDTSPSSRASGPRSLAVARRAPAGRASRCSCSTLGLYKRGRC